MMQIEQNKEIACRENNNYDSYTKSILHLYIFCTPNLSLYYVIKSTQVCKVITISLFMSFCMKEPVNEI